jgi:hypothetical protein
MTEPEIIPLDPPLTGGCQCGAVRYALHMQPVGAHYCHCRMCQRAVGNVFAALAPALKEKIEWTTRPPDFFRSSSAAQRGYCSKCGTPLTFAYDQSKWMCVTIGSLDVPEKVPPTKHYGIESQVHWLNLNDVLPREETGINYNMKDMAIFQYGGGSHG